MTPPAKTSASAQGQVNNQTATADVQTPTANPEKKEKSSEGYKHNAQGGSHHIRIGYGLTAESPPDSGHFAGKDGPFTDFNSYHLGYDYVYRFLDSKVSPIAGLGAEASRIVGATAPQGEFVTALTAEALLGLDWSPAWSANNVFSGPKYIDIFAGLGGATGETSNGGIRKFDKGWQLDTRVGARANLINARFNTVDLGLNFFLKNEVYHGPYNDAFWIPGLEVDAHWGHIEKNDCIDGEKLNKNIKDTETRIAALRADNDEQLAKLKVIRGYIETEPKHPHGGFDMDRGRLVGYIVDDLIRELGKPAPTKEDPKHIELSPEATNKIFAAVNAANKTKANEEIPAAMAKPTGLPQEKLQAMYDDGSKKLGNDPDFWQITEDVPADANASAKAPASESKKCVSASELDHLEDKLIDLMKIADQLSDRNRDLVNQNRTAIYLAGLSLGTEEIKDPEGFVGMLQVDVMQFRRGRPTEDDLGKLKAWAEKHKDNPAAIDDPELKQILMARGVYPGGGRPTGVTVMTPAAMPTVLKYWKDFGEFMTGKSDKLPSEDFRKEMLDKAKIQFPEKSGDDKALLDAYRKVIVKKKVILVGRTDSTGDAKFNEKLGSLRAEGLEYLIMGLSGMPAERFTTVSVAPTVQKVPEKGLAGEELLEARFYNRAVEAIMDQRQPKAVGTEVSKEEAQSNPNTSRDALKGEGIEVPKESPSKATAPKPATGSAAPAATPKPAAPKQPKKTEKEDDFHF